MKENSMKQRKYWYVFLITAATVFITAALPVAAQELSADELLEKADDAMYPETFEMTTTLTTERNGEVIKSQTIKGYYAEDVGSRLEIQSPARSKGIKFLQKGDSLWMYNPRSLSGRAIRLSGGSSFQGSVFSNDDIGDKSYSDDYDTQIAGSEDVKHEDIGTAECYILIGTPKNEKVQYGKIKMWVTKNNYIPLKMEFYAKSGMLFKKMDCSGIEHMAGRKRPTEFTMQSMEKQNTISRFTIDSMTINENIPDRMFTRRDLTR